MEQRDGNPTRNGEERQGKPNCMQKGEEACLEEEEKQLLEWMLHLRNHYAQNTFSMQNLCLRFSQDSRGQKTLRNGGRHSGKRNNLSTRSMSSKSSYIVDETDQVGKESRSLVQGARFSNSFQAIMAADEIFLGKACVNVKKGRKF